MKVHMAIVGLTEKIKNYYNAWTKKKLTDTFLTTFAAQEKNKLIEA